VSGNLVTLRRHVFIGEGGTMRRARTTVALTGVVLAAGVGLPLQGTLTANAATTTVAPHNDLTTSGKAVIGPVSVPVPKGATSATLNGITAISATNAWAVGSQTSTSGVVQPLIEHWDGTQWRVTPAPSFHQGAALTAVGGRAGDLWATGETSPQSFSGSGLILRYNGSVWTRVQLPKPPWLGFNSPTGVMLAGLDVVSDHDVWVTGQDVWSDGNLCGGQSVYVLHFDGKRWWQPNRSQLNNLLAWDAGTGITELQPGKALITSVNYGTSPDCSGGGEYYVGGPGGQWNRKSLVAAGSINGIGKVGSAIWAVGITYGGSLDTTGAVLAHWTGHGFKQKLILAGDYATLNGITAVGSVGYAVGGDVVPSAPSISKPLIVATTGASESNWQVLFDAPDPHEPTGTSEQLNAVSSVDGRVFSVGTKTGSAGSPMPVAFQSQ
jgi:hypothetical protein